MFTKKEIYRSRWEYIYFFSFFLSLWMTSATHIDVREMIYFCLYYYYFLLPFFFSNIDEFSSSFFHFDFCLKLREREGKKGKTNESKQELTEL